MSRFAASSPEGRRSLIAEAIAAHRERDSDFLTVAVEESAVESTDTPAGPPPWVQYRYRDELLNLDCTDSELPSVRSALETIGGATIREQQQVDPGGVNLRVAVPGDAERVAMAIETILREGFELPEGVRLWVVSI
ncbi:MAG: hypothetical protein ACOCP3_02995 [Halodesulfurarchaeum sp.]